LRSSYALLLAAALTLSGCSTSTTDFASDGSCDGVAVEINFSGEAENIERCVVLNGNSETAKNVLASAGISVEGTKAFGDAVVCRVNNVPSAEEELIIEGEDPYLETCEDMPAAFAYWALWVKESDSAEWGYAMEGISSLQLTKGQSVGLAFSLGGEAPTP
jgi:hypothetical protein